MYLQLGISELDKMCDDSDPVWVFGYGSLLWKPDFNYSQRETGFIMGFKRRFWQGNCTHRGTEDKPGRVVTIVEDSEETVWGVAFKLDGPDKTKAMNSLLKREVELGGYEIICTRFTSRDSPATRTVIVYAATQSNRYYLGDTDLDTMSSQVVDAHGHAGSNIEYVIKLAEYCRNNIPEDSDDHLFSLERHVKRLLKLRRTLGDSDETSSISVSDFCDCDIQNSNTSDSDAQNSLSISSVSQSSFSSECDSPYSFSINSNLPSSFNTDWDSPFSSDSESF